MTKLVGDPSLVLMGFAPVCTSKASEVESQQVNPRWIESLPSINPNLVYYYNSDI